MDSNENIKQAVMADMGLAFISAHTIALECQAKKLRILPAEDMPAMREWFTVNLKGKPCVLEPRRLEPSSSTKGQPSCVSSSETFQKSFCARDDRKIDH